MKKNIKKSNKKIIIFRCFFVLMAFLFSYKLTFAVGCWDSSVIGSLTATQASNGNVVLKATYSKALPSCSSVTDVQFEITRADGSGSDKKETAEGATILSGTKLIFTLTSAEAPTYVKAGSITFTAGVKLSGSWVASPSTSVPVTGAASPTTSSTIATATTIAGGATTTVAPGAGVDANGCPTGGSGTINFTNPLQFCTVEKILTSLLTNLQGIIATLSIIFIVIGGILYITSAGDEKRITTAKGAITAAMIGLAIGIAAPSFLKEIGTILGWTPTLPNDAGSPLTLSQIVLNVLNFLLSVAGVIALIMMVVGGIGYLTSAGDEDRIKGSKKIFLYSVIGIALVFAAMVIVRQIATFFVA